MFFASKKEKRNYPSAFSSAAKTRSFKQTVIGLPVFFRRWYRIDISCEPNADAGHG
jgi:hypothetical protein